MYSGRPIHPLVEEETPFPNIHMFFERTIGPWVPKGPETKNDCAGEGHLKTMVSSQSQRAETRDLEDLITEPLPSNGRLAALL
jgi:hypothetical protein